MVDSEKALQLFFDTGAEAGPVECPFYSPNPGGIRQNLTALYERLQAKNLSASTPAHSTESSTTLWFARWSIRPYTHTPYESFKLTAVSNGFGGIVALRLTICSVFTRISTIHINNSLGDLPSVFTVKSMLRLGASCTNKVYKQKVDRRSEPQTRRLDTPSTILSVRNRYGTSFPCALTHSSLQSYQVALQRRLD